MSEAFEKFFKEEYVREGFVWSKEHAEVFFNAGGDTLTKERDEWKNECLANNVLSFDELVELSRIKETVSSLTKENERLKEERLKQGEPCPLCKQLQDSIDENVCDSCLEYEDDGTPQTTYGWNENRVEGQHACACISESGPYQVIEAERDELQNSLTELRSRFKGYAAMIAENTALTKEKEKLRASLESLCERTRNLIQPAFYYTSLDPKMKVTHGCLHELLVHVEASEELLYGEKL